MSTKAKSKSKSRERKGHCFLCGRESTTSCTSCQKVHYCSREHYIYHRQQNYCFPFRIVWRAGKGKCMIASRDISALELILFDTAVVVGPRNKGGPVCLDCGKETNNPYSCGICSFPLCGELCQVGKAHQEECRILQKISSIKDKTSVYQWITPIRLLLKMASNPRIYRQIQFLLDNNSTTVEEDESVKNTSKDLLQIFLRTDQLKQFSLEDFIWIRGILATNCLMFGEEESRALFPHFSLMNHSCCANAKHTIYINKRKIAVQAQTDIKEGDEIVINYVTFIQGTALRREKLKGVWKYNKFTENN
ncbi:protein msta [Eurytemora carolleeae]|uniref:protein msta n=1 Tax=Eurytemora carolleeae TaxID=1294199 RepID=UPI000C78C7F2|nr:protein msta [Eurytemora carolleeae]|eukprot:XP_023323722.1 protein msta-like [Eurytemora affinis]